MGTTPNRGYVYPDSTSNARIWEHFGALATAVDTDVQSFLGKFVYRTTDLSFNTQTAMQNDTTLLVPVLANTVYKVETVFYITGPGNTASGNMKTQWTFPAGCTFTWGASGMEKASLATTATAEGKGEYLTYANTSSPSSPITYASGVNILTVIGKGLLIVGSTAGTLQLQWCQDASNGTNTTMKAGSNLQLTPKA